MKQRTFLAVIFMAAFLFLAAGISQLAVTDPVESNYALTALEMVRSGDWLSPQIYGTYWYDKPIFLYWLLSLSYSLLGTTDLAARLPAVLFGAASCTLAAWFALRQTGRRLTAILFAAMTVTSLIGWFISRSVITDQPLYFFSGATLFFAYIGLTEGKKSYVTAAYVMAAGAVLTKGPVGLVLPGLFLLLFIAIQRRPDYLKRLFPPVGIVLFLLLCLSWYGPMYNRHGMDFIDGLLGFNNVVRATVSEHPEYDVWYYYIVLVPVSLLPWTGPCLYGLWRRRSHRDEYVFMALWALGTILFYSLMATKYPTYAYIANWPLLYLGACTMQDWLDEDARYAWLAALIPASLYGLLFASLTAFTGKTPFPVPSLLLLTVFLSIMAGSYCEETLENGESRVVLKLPAALAPIKLAVLPLVKKDGLPEKAEEIMRMLRFDFRCQYDEKDSIGKRYRRQDAIGTPYCITVDHDTLKDNCVTIRFRDTMEQERVSIDQLHSIISEKVSMKNLLMKIIED